ncbi:uncharacterized protein EV420DRAFT_402680 [Desarmillaria tabescens]|uniref:F-box domain-containing protein n=1 Tax=Armillaria tabescens TaxID=1929756 RepID=A0AA39N4L9_ARMTA|nr:uncharacterized protein EV420DRAFT_402680 [Desarmillaria tabescens]KAK0457951.1 hypothetical protein EV420DRAFT_402680 [Desarmillaria tabescens]
MASFILPLPFNIAFTSLLRFSCSFTMCRRRQVRNVYTRCGHAVNLPEEIVQLLLQYCDNPLNFTTVFRFRARSLPASLVFSILRAASRRLVGRPVGNIVVILNSIVRRQFKYFCPFPLTFLIAPHIGSYCPWLQYQGC